jgi:hypothetical protein
MAAQDDGCRYEFRVRAQPGEETVYEVELHVTGGASPAPAIELATFRRFPLDPREEMGV